MMKKIMMLCLVMLSVIAGQAMAAAGEVKTSTSGDSLQQILVVGGVHFRPAKYHTMAKMGAEHGYQMTIKTSQEVAKDDADVVVKGYDLVLFHARNPKEGRRAFRQFKPLMKQDNQQKLIGLNWSDDKGIRKHVTKRQADELTAYITNGTQANFDRLADYFQYLLTGGKTDKPQPAVVLPDAAIYHPQASKLFTRFDQYTRWLKTFDPARPTIGVFFNRQLIEREQKEVVNDLLQRLEKLDMQIIPFFSARTYGLDGYMPLISDQQGVHIDTLVTFKPVHMANDRRLDWEKLGVPVIPALQYRDGDQATWEADNMGISPTMTPFFLTLPEAAGVIDATLVTATDVEQALPMVIDYQMQSLAEKAANLATLAGKQNQDKKVAVMVWNNPPGSANMGASFLNNPRSLAALTSALQQAGYQVTPQDEAFFIARTEDINGPFYQPYDADELVKRDLAELMPLQRYLDWYQTIPQTVRDSIEAEWGKPDNGFMQVERDGQIQFVIPRMKLGNVIVLRQPPRSDSLESEKKLYHSRIVPINHYYLAAYLYVREHFAADALVHLGTHGTQEWLPGKERALSRYDASNLSVGEIPVVYPFIIDDIGEAMQAKRRGRATIIAHSTPPFATAGLQQELVGLHDLMHQYRNLDQGEVKKNTLESMVEQCVELGMCDEIGWDMQTAKADIDAFLEALHGYMEDVASELQPLGLHTLGETQQDQYLLSTILQMLGPDFVATISEWEPAAREADQHEQGDTHQHGVSTHLHDDVSHGLNATDDLMAQPGMYTLSEHLVHRDREPDYFPQAAQEYLSKAEKYYQDFHAQQEMQNLIKAMAGKYIPVRNGGDPVRTPDSLPSGYNLFGFDPAKVPTKEAWEAGKKLVDQAIEDYRNKHGVYPDKMAFSLWSIETMRHYGVLEAQAMYAMGVKPVWRPGGYVAGTEVIPYEELGRPRVDVVLSATGLYRDAFSNVMLLLAEAVDKVARMKEPYNHLYQNAQNLLKTLIEQGVEPEEADQLSTIRVFSAESGNYGTGLAGATMASDSWEKDDKLADLYMKRMGFAFGKDPSRWGTNKVPDLYGKVLSGTDITLLSRSSNVYGMLASDEPFQYLGGLSLAIRSLDGKSPEMMITNLRNPKGIKVENAQRFLSRELRTRNLHTRWVKEMQEEGYAGANEIAANIDNLWGWDVMDPELVSDGQWQDVFEVYVEDKLNLDINEWFENVHPKAQAALVERLLEVARKEYWKTDQQTLKKMMERYLELAEKYDYHSMNSKFNEFVAENASGFGLELPLAKMPELNMAAPPQAKQVEGMKMEQVQAAEVNDNNQRYFLMAFCLIAMLMGGLRQATRRLA